MKKNPLISTKVWVIFILLMLVILILCFLGSYEVSRKKKSPVQRDLVNLPAVDSLSNIKYVDIWGKLIILEEEDL